VLSIPSYPFLRLAMIDPLSPSGAPHRIDA